MNTPWRDRPWRLRSAALLVAAWVVLCVQWLAPRSLSGVEEQAGDLAWRVGASLQPERRLVVVDIDEASLRELGAWPWPRATLAQLSLKLGQAGAVVQAYDINFSDSKEGDGLLRDAWARSPVVAGQLFSIDPGVTPRAGELAGALGQTGCPPFAPRSHGFYGTAPVLLGAHPAIGHLTPRVEADGVVRKVPALVCQDGRAYPSLALTALWRAGHEADAGQQLPTPDWQWQRADEAEGGWWGPHAWLTSASLPGLKVPVDDRGDLRVPYRLDRKAFASVSAAEVLRDGSDLSVLKGALVLVGATAFGIGDTVATPHASVAAGLEIHAQTVAAMLDHRLPYSPRHAGTLAWLAILVIGLILLVLSQRRGSIPAKRLPLAGVVLAAVGWLGASVLLVQADLWLPWSAPALFAMLGSVSLATAEHALTRAQRERLSAHLGAYLPGPVAQQLMVSDPSGSLQVEQRSISVLLADIRNFSAFAAHRPPQETAAVLHAFCCIAVDVVEQHGGVVENVVGDSVLAVWNAYSECADHSQQALAAAQELVRATRQLLEGTQPTSESSPVQPLALGVGVETGSAIVGSFGPTRRRAHAALGEPVSVASRIQQMTLDLSIPILVGPNLASSLPADAMEPLGEYLLEGLGRHYALYAPRSWGELVPTDPQWVRSATATADRLSEPSGWSHWADSSNPGPLQSGAASIHLRDA